ncbi:MAG: hypothetical protein PVF45_05035 [Anaerolineae bacterium]|jgi:hypothetical protein
MDTFYKDPDAKLDYVIDWSSWLGSDTIQTSAWTVASGLTEESNSKTDTTATVWLSGGTAGKTYRVTNHIVTVGGREDDRSFWIVVQER